MPITGTVSGTVAVSNLPATQAVAGSVDVRTSSSDRAPYQRTVSFNPDSSVCTQFVCTVLFDKVPVGKRWW